MVLLFAFTTLTVPLVFYQLVMHIYKILVIFLFVHHFVSFDSDAPEKENLFV